jgi:outer membrane PBP1 activator LpoA protein
VATNVFAQQKDVEAIKAVISKETSSFMNVNQKNWSDTWLKVPYAYWSYADSTGTNFVEGWDELNKTFDTYFRTQKPSKATLFNEWQEIRVYGNGAYARFIQKVKDDIDYDETSQVRVLEKNKEGQWKVICVVAIAKYSTK